MKIKEFQAEFAKIYKEMRSDIDCSELDVRIWQKDNGKIIVNFDIR